LLRWFYDEVEQESTPSWNLCSIWSGRCWHLFFFVFCGNWIPVGHCRPTAIRIITSNKFVQFVNGFFHLCIFMWLVVYYRVISLVSFKFNFPEFQHKRNSNNNNAKFNFCCVFVILTQWLGQSINSVFLRLREFDSQQFWQISINFSLFFQLDLFWIILCWTIACRYRNFLSSFPSKDSARLFWWQQNFVVMPRFDDFWVRASSMYATTKLYNLLYPNSFLWVREMR
jgi:hypothetical protein